MTDNCSEVIEEKNPYSFHLNTVDRHGIEMAQSSASLETEENHEPRSLPYIINEEAFAAISTITSCHELSWSLDSSPITDEPRFLPGINNIPNSASSVEEATTEGREETSLTENQTHLDPANLEQLQCPVCASSFSIMANFKRHIKTKHTHTRLYYCGNYGCSASDTRRDNILRHEWKHCKFRSRV